MLESQSGLYTDLILRQDATPTSNPQFVQAIESPHDRERIKKTLLRGYALSATIIRFPRGTPITWRYCRSTLTTPTAKSLIKTANLSGTAAEMVVPPSIESALDSALMMQPAAMHTDLNLPEATDSMTVSDAAVGPRER